MNTNFSIARTIYLQRQEEEEASIEIERLKKVIILRLQYLFFCWSVLDSTSIDQLFFLQKK